MLRSLSVLGLFLAASMMSGCFGLGGYSVSGEGGPAGPAVTSGLLTLANGNQAGDMGSVRGFDGAATRHSGTYDSYGSSLRIDSEGSDWWVMSAIYVQGDLAGPAFAPGTHRVYTSGTYDDTNVSVTGCSGPEYGNYTYDGGADRVTIDIVDLGDGNRRMNFETEHDGSVTTGSVDYRIEGSSGSVDPRGI